jgi:hypothetical protein
MTADVDVTVEVDETDVPELVRRLEGADFEIRVADVLAFARRTRVIPAVHRPTSLPVDLVLAGTPLEALFLDAATIEDVGGVDAPVISAEHLVVTKILAGRPKDLEDARAVLETTGDAFDVTVARKLLGQLDAALDRSDLATTLDAALSEGRSGDGS